MRETLRNVVEYFPDGGRPVGGVGRLKNPNDFKPVKPPNKVKLKPRQENLLGFGKVPKCLIPFGASSFPTKNTSPLLHASSLVCSLPPDLFDPFRLGPGT